MTKTVPPKGYRHSHSTSRSPEPPPRSRYQRPSRSRTRITKKYTSSSSSSSASSNNEYKNSANKRDKIHNNSRYTQNHNHSNLKSDHRSLKSRAIKDTSPKRSSKVRTANSINDFEHDKTKRNKIDPIESTPNPNARINEPKPEKDTQQSNYSMEEIPSHKTDTRIPKFRENNNFKGLTSNERKHKKHDDYKSKDITSSPLHNKDQVQHKKENFHQRSKFFNPNSNSTQSRLPHLENQRPKPYAGPSSPYNRGDIYRQNLQSTVDRAKVSPFLLRVFLKINGEHSLNDFAVRSKEPVEDELQLYFWMDTNLRELVDLVKEVCRESRNRNSYWKFRLIYTDKQGRNSMSEIGSVHSTRVDPRMDYKTLQQFNFRIGDFIDISIKLGRNFKNFGNETFNKADIETKLNKGEDENLKLNQVGGDIPTHTPNNISEE